MRYQCTEDRSHDPRVLSTTISASQQAFPRGCTRSYWKQILSAFVYKPQLNEHFNCVNETSTDNESERIARCWVQLHKKQKCREDNNARPTTIVTKWHTIQHSDWITSNMATVKEVIVSFIRAKIQNNYMFSFTYIAVILNHSLCSSYIPSATIWFT